MTSVVLPAKTGTVTAVRVTGSSLTGDGFGSAVEKTRADVA